jgi:hypothetical protein
MERGRPGVLGGLTLLVVTMSLWLVGCGDSALGHAPSCRTYATAYTHSIMGLLMFNVTCTHAEDGSGFDRTCTGERSTVEHWASRGDFIDEVAAVGILRLATYTINDTDTTITYEYDSQRRVQRLASPLGVDETFDAWDELGRPLHRLTHAGACPGADITISYGARTITSDVPAELPCGQHTVQTFDADGIPTTVEYGNVDITPDVYVTMGRTTICR